MRSISLTELRTGFSGYLRLVHSEGGPLVITRYGRPYVILQPLGSQSAEDDFWSGLSRDRLARVWKGENSALYDYL
jgi:prevent-host-death family protein